MKCILMNMNNREQTNSFAKHPLITMPKNAGNGIVSYSELISLTRSFQLKDLSRVNSENSYSPF